LNPDKRQSFFRLKLEARIDAEKTAFTGCFFLLKIRCIDWNIRFVHPSGLSTVSYFMCISFRQVLNLSPGKFDDRKIR